MNMMHWLKYLSYLESSAKPFNSVKLKTIDLMMAMGIAFKAPDRYEKRLSNYSAGQNPGILPVPSLFVVETDGTILFEYVNPDYKQRISSDLLMSVLRALNEDR